MATWITPTIHGAAEDLAITDYNNTANNTMFLFQRPYIMAYNSTTTAINSGGITQIPLTSLTGCAYGFILSSNAVIVPLTGMYRVFGSVGLNGTVGAAGPGYVGSFVYRNGAVALQGSQPPGDTGFPGSSVTGLIYAATQDQLTLYGQNQGGTNSTTLATASQTFLHVVYEGSV